MLLLRDYGSSSAIYGETRHYGLGLRFSGRTEHVCSDSASRVDLTWEFFGWADESSGFKSFLTYLGFLGPPPLYWLSFGRVCFVLFKT